MKKQRHSKKDYQKAFSLACEIIDNQFTCPYDIEEFDRSQCPSHVKMEDCSQESEKCWERWLLQCVKETTLGMVCRVCECTDLHACEGGCYWVEPNLCSRCAGKE